MQSRPKLQHYVPQLLLRLHASDPAVKRGSEQVWCLDKQTDKVFSPNIRGVAAETGFYEVEIDGAIYSLEESLSRLENVAGPVLTGIVHRRSLVGISEENRLAVAIFAAVQFVRTQATREDFRAMNDAFVSVVTALGADPALVPGLLMAENDVRASTLDVLRDALQTYTPHFLNKHWYLIEALPDDPFHIGDNPLVRDNDRPRGFYGNLGLACPGISIYLPLSPTLCLGIIDPDEVTKVRHTYYAARREQETFRKRLAKKARKAGLAIPLEQLASIDSVLDNMEAQIKPLLNGVPGPYDARVVERINSLQMFYATRWVISSKNDFALPKRMIADNPEYRRGATIEVTGPSRLTPRT